MLNKVGKVIKHHRERLGMSQLALANYCGVSEKRVGQWESGRRVPTRTNTNIMVHLFEISIEEITTGRERIYEFLGSLNDVLIPFIGISILVFFMVSGVGIFTSNNNFKIIEYPIYVSDFLHERAENEATATLSVDRKFINADYVVDIVNESEYGVSMFKVAFTSKKLDRVLASYEINKSAITLLTETSDEVMIENIVVNQYEGDVTIRVYYSIFFNPDDLFEKVYDVVTIKIEEELLKDELLGYTNK